MKNIKIKETYLLLLIVIGLISLACYSTYALFTTSTEIENVVDFFATLSTESRLLEYETITLAPGETRIIDINVNNSHDTQIYYGSWYEIISGTDIEVGIYSEQSSGPSSGVILANSNITLIAGVTNFGEEDAIIKVGTVGSLTPNLGLGDNRTLLQEYATGELSLSSNILNNSVQLTRTGPISDEQGEASTPYIFSITNNGDYAYRYNVKFADNTTSAENKIDDKYIKLKVNNEETVTLGDLKKGVILKDFILEPGVSAVFSFRAWISDKIKNDQIGKEFLGDVTIDGLPIPASEEGQRPNFVYSNHSSTIVNVGLDKYIMPNVTETSETIGNHEGIYYPIVEMVMSDGLTTHQDAWKAYYPVFDGTISITDYLNDGSTITYDSSTQALPSNLSVVGDVSTIFNYDETDSMGVADAAPTEPIIVEEKLYYSSPSIASNKSEYNKVVKYKYIGNNGIPYFYYVGYHAVAQTFQSCFAKGTLILLADGTQKPIEDITFNDKVITWDLFEGKLTQNNISLIVDHGSDIYEVVNLEFSDGTNLKVIGEHGIFDYDLNKFLYINKYNYMDYIGHRFVKYDNEGTYNLVTLDNSYIEKEYTNSYSIASSNTTNVFASNLLTLTPPNDFFNWIEMGDKLKYDTDKFYSDLKKYGLYTYDDFKDYLSYESYSSFGGQYLKIPVEKGKFTFDYIIDLIKSYEKYMTE